MNKTKQRMLSLVLIIAALIGIVAACQKQSAQTTKTEGGQAVTTAAGGKDSIVIATMSETPTLSPYSHNATAGSYMNLLTYSTLFATDMDLNPQPELVESYENESETRWVFHLKQGVKFHDGSEMTAQDVKASLEYAKTFAEVSQYNNMIASVEVVDDYTVAIETNGPSAVLLTNLCSHGNAIVPKKLIDEGHDFGEDPVGTGPYKLVEWKRGDSLTFEAFDEYFGGAPAIKHMTWKIIPEGSSRTIALEAGEVDFIVEVEAMDADRIQENENLELLSVDSTTLNWMVLNNEKPGLSNENMRRAINAAINKENVITVALNGLGKVAEGEGASMLTGYSAENTDSYDVEKAKEYMEKSGVEPSSVEMSIVCSNDTKKRAAEVIQADLKEIGIEAEIESMDLATYLSATVEGDFTAAIGGYTATDLMTHVQGVFHSNSIGGSNQARFSDPEVDALIDQASATVDEDARNELLQQIMAKANQACPNIPLYTATSLRAYAKGLEGVEVNAGGTMRFEKCSWAD